jgi:hypothetical protein
MSSRSDEYRHRAAEAKNRAAQTNSPSLKSAFEEVARGWLLLAEQMEWLDFATRRGHEQLAARHAYAATREDAMTAFANSWRRNDHQSATS